MRPSPSLLSTLRLTLFTRASCGLCDVAKTSITTAAKTRAFAYHEVDIMAAGHEKWRDAYDFDVPVLHVDAAGADLGLDAARKLMHRFTAAEVEKVVDEVEQTLKPEVEV